MADYTIAAGDRGVYEIPLTAGTVVTVDVKPTTGQKVAGAVTVFVHSGNSPVYVRRGTTVTARDAAADMVPPFTVADLPLGVAGAGVVAFVSASAAVISVCRP